MDVSAALVVNEICLHEAIVIPLYAISSCSDLIAILVLRVSEFY